MTALKSLLKSIDVQRRSRSLLLFCAVALVFGISYTQDAIYHSPENQNTKYLHGLALAGHGFLAQDWTANTLNPLPAFTALVRFTYQLHPEYAFYAYYFIVFGLYVFSLTGIAASIYPAIASRARWVPFFALLLLVHCLDIEIGDIDIGWHLYAGVAQQYILGPVFQPANFGVFLLVSIWLFLQRRGLWALAAAAACLAVAVTFHPAYLPSVGALTLAYMVVLARQRQWISAASVGLVSGLLALPVLLYMLITFSDTSPELAQQATAYIVNERIPHHSLPAEWVDSSVYLQMLVVGLGVYLGRRHPLAIILGVPFAVAILGTVLQVITGSDFIAFVAPWRISVFLLPVATSVALGALVSWLPLERARARRFAAWLSATVIVILAIVGGVEQWHEWHPQDGTEAMMTYVKQTVQPDEVYLLPHRDKRLRRFRLYTGAPIYINRKSHPYKDVEVIEWSDRLALAKRFYNTKKPQAQCQLLRRRFSQAGVTHVVFPQEVKQRCPELQKRYRDEEYSVYEWLPKRRDKPKASIIPPAELGVLPGELGSPSAGPGAPG
ncbi:MAG: DUF6798 domain-containing protein [Elainellaceae cyanobacterium]